ncbi:MAG TPA: tRNA pseudouridine(38-40) synthase TruA [Chthoniobacterales bacterium]
MAQRIKLIVAYDGAPFAGWQSQLHGKTVQDQLENAARRITGERIRVHGAGRTDTGVHALGQCAHLDLPKPKFTPDQLRAALNAVLPPTIRVLRCQRVASTFHARFSATGKVYRYRIWHGPVLPPLEFGRAWHVPNSLDSDALRNALSRFRGRHDFAGFAANRGQPPGDTVRTISAVRLTRRGPCLTMEFAGDGFLYKMVRMMVGATVLCGQGKLSTAELAQRFHGGLPGGPRLVAPAAGLFLIRVRY